MATASSAQREPSMEEILASIRRIIEDNDTGKKNPGETDSPRQDHDMPDNDAPPMRESTIIEVDAFRAELRGAQTDAVEVMPEPRGEAFPMRSQMPDAPEKKAVTLAEVQAQIASEARPAPEFRAPDRPAFSERRESSFASKPVADSAPPAAPKPSVEAVVPSAALEEEPAPANNRPSLPDSFSTRPGIISERAERQVAAAFGELSEAFASRAQKSFDEMAEEMMRPMLRDWLDNNLPVLVERLVREEIERVARGAQ